jgi:predicted PurR-regulated permease PerM
MKPVTVYPFYVRASLVFIGLFALVAMLVAAQNIIVPLIYSTILAIVLSPVVNFLVRKKINRLLAITITLLLVIFITVALVILLSFQMIQLGESFPELVHNFNRLIDQSVTWVSHNFNISTRKINLWLAAKNLEFLKDSGSNIGQKIINTGNVLIILVLIPVYIFMILFYQRFLLEFLHRVFHTDQHTNVNEVLTATKKIIQSYLVGLLLEAFIIATLNSVCLLILGIDYAILLGVIGAVVNIIPYLGGMIAVALPMLIALATKSPVYALLVLASYIVIQFVDNHFIIPKIVASKVKINALVSIVAVLAGAELWGVPGMFLSIPLTAIIKLVFDHVDGLKPLGYLLGNIVPTSSKNNT